MSKFDLDVTIDDSKPELTGLVNFSTAIYNRTLENNHFRLKEFNSRRELKKFIRPVFELINKTYAHIYGFSELTVKEMDYFANRYISVINPKFVKVIFDGRE
jgi:hypothetical protein